MGCVRSAGGVIEHELSETYFEVIDELDVDESDSQDDEADHEVGKPDAGDKSDADAADGSRGPSSPRRKWLLRQEVGEGALHELADSESNEVPAGRPQGGAWRSRAAMRRVRQKAADLLVSPLRRTAESTLTYRI